MNTSSSPEPLSNKEEASTKHKKTWTVGTLTYTSGGIVLLFFWLLFGDFAWSMRERSVGSMAAWYLSHLNVPNILFALLMSAGPSLIGLVLGPIISVKSDNHRGKWGRRIPFLLITTPIAALGIIGLGLTPLVATWLHELCNSHSVGQWLHANLGGFPGGETLLAMLSNEMVVSVFCFGIFWAGFEFATIASYSVFGGLINDVVPKEFLGRFYGLFRAVSLIDGIIFNYWIMGHVPNYFTWIMIGVGIFYGCAFTWVCFHVKEGEYPPPPPVTEKKGIFAAFGKGTGVYFKECFSHSYYIAVFFMITLGSHAFAPINVFAIPYARSLNVDMTTYGHGLALTYAISLLLAFPLGWLVDKFHQLRMAMITMFTYIIVAVSGAFLAKDAESFLVIWVIHGVLSGCYLTTSASLAMRLYPHEKFAQFASAGGIIGSLFSMVLSPAIGIIIDQSGGYYRYTFVGAAIISIAMFSLSLYVYSRFVKYGGVKGYVAPFMEK